MRHGGTLDKYIGDAIMAFWNAPIAQPDHAKRAVEASIALDNHLAHINEMLKPHLPEDIKDHEIRIGVGIATGQVVVGNFGSKRKIVIFSGWRYCNLAARSGAFWQTDRPTTCFFT